MKRIKIAIDRGFPELPIMCLISVVFLGIFFPKGTMLITDILIYVGGVVTLCVLISTLFSCGSRGGDS